MSPRPAADSEPNEKRAPRNLGILGGTFDPVHAGHIRFANEVRRHLGLDAVALVPAGIPVHRRPPRATMAQRRVMLDAATSGHDALFVDDRELLRNGPAWTIDTLASFRAESRRRPLCLLLGTDQLCALDTWRRWQELTDFAHLVIAPRSDGKWPEPGAVSRWAESRWCDDPRLLRSEPAGHLYAIDLPPVDISATLIRARRAAGESLGDLVPAPVRDYIERENLYTDDT